MVLKMSSLQIYLIWAIKRGKGTIINDFLIINKTLQITEKITFFSYF